MADPVERVAALLARAADCAATEEEARTAAVQAARLIRQHGLRVVSGNAAPVDEKGPIITPARVDRAMDVVEELVDVGRGIISELRRDAKPRRRRRRMPRSA